MGATAQQKRSPDDQPVQPPNPFVPAERRGNRYIRMWLHVMFRNGWIGRAVQHPVSAGRARSFVRWTIALALLPYLALETIGLVLLLLLQVKDPEQFALHLQVGALRLAAAIAMLWLLSRVPGIILRWRIRDPQLKSRAAWLSCYLCAPLVLLAGTIFALADEPAFQGLRDEMRIHAIPSPLPPVIVGLYPMTVHGRLENPDDFSWQEQDVPDWSISQTIVLVVLAWWVQMVGFGTVSIVRAAEAGRGVLSGLTSAALAGWSLVLLGFLLPLLAILWVFQQQFM